MGGSGVLVGGSGVLVGGFGVLVGGFGVLVDGTGVFVGGTGVSVGGGGCVGAGPGGGGGDRETPRGGGRGDRVGGFLPNVPEAVVAMLAVASRGAVWSSCSPDFGVSGVLDRFGQIEPKVLVCADGYSYNGKTIDSLERVRGI
ncbi:MAG: AMP-binding protein, partial [Chloroflexi bacterium]|nr:AMP-binding protein [Chloroflexota bacterium]